MNTEIEEIKFFTVDQVRDAIHDALDATSYRRSSNFVLLDIDDSQDDSKLGLFRLDAGEVWLVTIQRAALTTLPPSDDDEGGGVGVE